MGLGLEASPEEIRIFLEEAEEQILTRSEERYHRSGKKFR